MFQIIAGDPFDKPRAKTGHRMTVLTVRLFLPCRSDVQSGETRRYPPAMAPMIKNGSFPKTTASGRGVSGGNSDKSSSHAKKRKNARRCSVRSEERRVGKEGRCR